jgi:hypothetical protein
MGLSGAARSLYAGALTMLALAGVGTARAQAGAQKDSLTTPGTERRSSISERVRRDIDQLRASAENSRVPPADSFTLGPRAVPSGSATNGPIAVAQGTLDVFGRIEGGAYVLDGDIVVHRGGVITGDALAVGGRVLLDGGRVEGEIRSLSGVPGSPQRAEPARPPLTTWESVKLVFGWFAILVVIGLGVMIFAESNLDGVVEAIESSFSRAFWFGVLGQIMVLPALLLLVLGLVLTLLGILLVPFAVVAYTIAAAGLFTLGFLAVARLTGGIWSRADSAASPRGAHLRALFIGLVIYMGLWMIAALFAWHPLAGALLRGVALAASWVAATVGLGAALISRAGTQRPGVKRGASTAGQRPAPADLAWQTPTPVTGVAAARRPVVTTKDVP